MLESTTLTPSNTHATPTLRQQIDNLPPYVLSVWRSRYANEGTDLEARAIIDREAAAIRARGETADALAVWIRLADTAGKLREPLPAVTPSACVRPHGNDRRAEDHPALRHYEVPRLTARYR